VEITKRAASPAPDPLMEAMPLLIRTVESRRDEPLPNTNPPGSAPDELNEHALRLMDADDNTDAATNTFADIIEPEDLKVTLSRDTSGDEKVTPAAEKATPSAVAAVAVSDAAAVPRTETLSAVLLVDDPKKRLDAKVDPVVEIVAEAPMNDTEILLSDSTESNMMPPDEADTPDPADAIPLTKIETLERVVDVPK
jgi:hypothetical protein